MNAAIPLQDVLDRYVRLTRTMASEAAADRHYRPCTHDLAASEDAETAVWDLFTGAERAQARDLLGQVFFHLTEIEKLHAKQKRPVRLTCDSTIDERANTHQAEVDALIEQIKALLR